MSIQPMAERLPDGDMQALQQFDRSAAYTNPPPNVSSEQRFKDSYQRAPRWSITDHR